MKTENIKIIERLLRHMASLPPGQPDIDRYKLARWTAESLGVPSTAIKTRAEWEATCRRSAAVRLGWKRRRAKA